MTVERQRLCRRWIHAHEEDSDREMVFRPADAELPPSRGRTVLELRDDGALVESTPGPTDRPESATGTWSLEEGGQLVTRGRQGARSERVVTADPDRLVLEKG